MNFTLIIGIVFGSVFTALMCGLVSCRLLGILQQEGYRGGAFVKWYCRRGNMQQKRLALLSLALALLTALFNLCFYFVPMPFPNLIALLPFAGIFVLYLLSEKKYALKVRVRFTPRLKRLMAAHLLLNLILCAGLCFSMAFAALAADMVWLNLLRFVPIALLPALLPFTLYLANGLAKCYEIPHTNKFVRRAKETLAKSNCVKVGITGSFGKTSVKHFALQMLSEKFRVMATPASYNTPAGIAKYVNTQGADCDIFLAEMGARRTGDIGELCDMVCPNVAVVTGVCSQHLETFGSLEAIFEEKKVLATRAEKVILGTSAKDMKEGALLEGEGFAAEDISLGCEGTKFTLRIGGKSAKIEVGLLGRHAAEDVALAAALCFSLGMSFEEIVAATAKLQPVPHRLEKIEGNGLLILDDSYNSNVAGAHDAVEVLKLATGRRAVVTPGLVELGVLEEEENGKLGAALVGLDLIILVGETQALYIRNGYLAAGGEAEKLRIVPTLEGAQKLLAEELAAGDAVLFLNDLPDCYS